MATRALTSTVPLRNKRTVWKALQSHYNKLKGVHLRELFVNDPLRGERMTAEGVGLYLDYSKNRVNGQTLKLLIELAEESALQVRIDAMFRGEKVNTTEKRPALHVAMRARKGASIYVDGENVVPKVHAVLERMGHFCDRVRSGEWKGYSGKSIRNVVNIGTGGSHFGPSLTIDALKSYADPSLTFRFVANIDETDFFDGVRNLDPAETLFIISSKSFTTLETVTNFRAAREWLLSGTGGDERTLAKHFVAVSANIPEVTRHGINSGNIFEFWDWVGERYSICSAVGLPTMLAIGPKGFAAMLDGFHQMDSHYLATPFERNLPVLMGLLSIWYNNVFGAESFAVIPYAQSLHRFPSYLQQLTMESNGKHVTLIGTEVTQQTSPVCWGDIGTCGQHSFFQLLHQGTRLIPCDFIVLAQSVRPATPHQDLLVANAFAQSTALAFGKTAEQIKAEGTPDWLVPHRVFDGNRPSNTILAQKLTPETLGKLIALYEHSVHTQGAIWNINSFDQWGVELGKELAHGITLQLQNAEDAQLDFDSSTASLIRQYWALKKEAPDARYPSH